MEEIVLSGINISITRKSIKNMYIRVLPPDGRVQITTAISFDFDRAAPFAEGLAYFSIGDTYGFMDKTGTQVLSFVCDSVSSFQEGLAFFSIEGRYGYIDQSGQVVLEPVFDDAGYFKEGLAKVMKNGRYGIINRDGTFIVVPEYDTIAIDGPFIIAQSEGNYTCFDRAGKVLLEQSDYILPAGGESMSST